MMDTSVTPSTAAGASVSTGDGTATASGGPCIKIRKIDADADAESRAVSALHPESDDVLEVFKCPICLEIPLEEIYQCMNGHTICKRCKDKIKRRTCVQCKGKMTADEGDNWIRCLALEKILDTMWITCPFRKRGCKETMRRAQVSKHVEEDCRFNDNRIAICRYLSDGTDCKFNVNCAKPKEAVEHFLGHHRGVLCKQGNVSLFPWTMPQNKTKYPIVISKNPRKYLLVIGFNQDVDSVRFVGISLNKPDPEGATETMEVEIKSYSKKVAPFKVVMPVIPFPDVVEALRERPVVRLRKAFLHKHYEDATTGEMRLSIKIT